MQRTRTPSGNLVSLHSSEALPSRRHRFARIAGTPLQIGIDPPNEPRPRSSLPPPMLGLRLMLGVLITSRTIIIIVVATSQPRR